MTEIPRQLIHELRNSLQGLGDAPQDMRDAIERLHGPSISVALDDLLAVSYQTKKAMTEGINAQSEVVTLGAEFWKEVLAWGRERKRLTPKDMQILEVCASMPRRIPSDLQARHALDALGRMRDQGFGE